MSATSIANPVSDLLLKGNSALAARLPVGTTVQTAAYTASPGELVLCNPSGGAFAVTLPAAASCPGSLVIVKNQNVSGTAINVTPNGTDNIDGANSAVAMTGAKNAAAFISDGTGWNIVSAEVGGVPAFYIAAIQTSAYTASPGECVRCNPTGGGFTVTLPLTTTCKGAVIFIKNESTSTNTITIAPNAADAIDGGTVGANATSSSSKAILRYVSDGANNWMAA